MVLPTKGELLAKINDGNTGIVESDYPFTYAHRFLVAYPEVIPSEITTKILENVMISTPARTASATLQYWAESVGAEKETIAIVLADAWIEKHYKPLALV